MDYITKLLGIQGIIIDNIEEAEKSIIIDISTQKTEQICHSCGSVHCHVHDYRIQQVRDIPFRQKSLIFRLRKRRYVCCKCGKRFYEEYKFLKKYCHSTNRTYDFIVEELKEICPFSSVARRYFVSPNTVIRAFDKVSYQSPQSPPEIVSIDEFKGNCDKEKYHCIITAPESKQLIDILPNRKKKELVEYFKGFIERDTVKFAIIDMWESYKDTAKVMFKNAKIVIDKYHYVRQVTWAVDAIRIRIQNEFSKEKRIGFKKNRSLFYKNYNQLDSEQQQQLNSLLDKSEELRTAWNLKEKFAEFRNCSNYEEAREILSEWVQLLKNSKLADFADCIKAFDNWFEEILNSKLTSYTNAFTEGKNNKIKVIKRNAFGYKNFERFRNRILHCA